MQTYTAHFVAPKPYVPLRHILSPGVKLCMGETKCAANVGTNCAGATKCAVTPLHKTSSESVHNFLSNVVHRQTDKETNQRYQKHNLHC